MANSEHLAQLKQGVEHWNKWRKENLDVLLDLNGANLFEANLTGAILFEANLFRATLREANLTEASLTRAILVDTQLNGANLVDCNVYGISVWNVQLEGAIQSNLRITPSDKPVIQVDNLEVAQFLYLLLNNERIRHVIDTITSKVVLILGRFTPERKAILDALRDELRNHNYTPVLFDFEKIRQSRPDRNYFDPGPHGAFRDRRHHRRQ
jgi:Pentapeptide repeats (8 copies)